MVIDSPICKNISVFAFLCNREYFSAQSKGLFLRNNCKMPLLVWFCVANSSLLLSTEKPQVPATVSGIKIKSGNHLASDSRTQPDDTSLPIPYHKINATGLLIPNIAHNESMSSAFCKFLFIFFCVDLFSQPLLVSASRCQFTNNHCLF